MKDELEYVLSVDGGPMFWIPTDRGHLGIGDALSLTLFTGSAIADPLYMGSGEGENPGALQALVQEKQLAKMTRL